MITINKKENWIFIICTTAILLLLLISPDLLAANSLFDKGETKLVDASTSFQTWFWAGATLAGVVTVTV